MRCVCQHELATSDRLLTVRLKVDWKDGRGIHEKDAHFCSFGCLADWATGRAEQHDVEPEPEPEPERPKRTRKTAVDKTTERVIR